MTKATVLLEAQLDYVWTSLSAYLDMRQVVDVVSGKQGDLFIASPGRLSFRLLNATHIFSFDRPELLSGWSLGVPVRLRAIVSSTTYDVFYGLLGVCVPDTKTQLASCTVFDGMWSFERGTLPFPGVLETVDPADEVRILTQEVYFPPQQDGFFRLDHPEYGKLDTGALASGDEGYDLDEGVESYPWIGDVWRNDQINTLRALRDVANSGLNHIYIDRLGQIVFASRYRRAGDSTISFVFDPSTLTDDDTVYKLESNPNIVRVSTIPRVQETSLVVIWALTSKKRFSKDDTEISFTVSFSDPVQEAVRIAAWYIEPLEPYTDYTLINDIIGDLNPFISVSAEYTPSGAKYVVTLTGEPLPRSAYFSFFQQRGKILKAFDDYRSEARNSEDIALRGEDVLDFNMPLQDQVSFADDAADFMLEKFTKLLASETVLVDSRVSEASMVAALTLDVSDRVTVTDPETGIDQDYFVENRHVVFSSPTNVRAWLFCTPSDFDTAWVLDRSALDDDTLLVL